MYMHTKVPLEENLAMIADSIAAIVAAGREAMFDCEHFFDGYKANPDYAVVCDCLCMCVCVCMSACQHVCLYVCISVTICLLSIYPSIHACMHACMHACIHPSILLYCMYTYGYDLAQACARAAHEAGASWVVLCDTNGGSLPDEIHHIVRYVYVHLPISRSRAHARALSLRSCEHTCVCCVWTSVCMHACMHIHDTHPHTAHCARGWWGYA